MQRIYLDHNATCPPVAAARAALLQAAGAGWANPASAHEEGRQARAVLERARSQVAALVDTGPEHIFFTSGGTEAAHAAIQGVGLGSTGRRIVYSGLEHASVRGAVAALGRAGMELVEVAPEPTGVMDATKFIDACRPAGTALAVLIQAHNELGTVQPVSAVAAALGDLKVPLVVDAVQAPGRMAAFMPGGAQTLTLLSAHKLGGFPGAGAVVADPELPLLPFMAGGEQERRRRGGTPALPLVAAMGAAAQVLHEEGAGPWRGVGLLCRRFEEGLMSLSEHVRILGRDVPRIPNTSAFMVDGVRGEDIVAALDLAGIAVSSGSACSTGSTRPSTSLLAMGFDEEAARSLVRVSMGPATTADEIERALDTMGTVLKRMRRHAVAR